jgi:hypothetical protein
MALGYRRIHGELLVLGIKVAASTVREILQQAGVDPVSERTSCTWVSFLRSQADALIACDFFETVTLTGDPVRSSSGAALWFQPRPVPAARGAGQAAGSAGSEGAVRQMT